jgi:hypothetical protein
MLQHLKGALLALFVVASLTACGGDDGDGDGGNDEPENVWGQMNWGEGQWSATGE